jgi:hypothetical protein
MSTRIIIDTYRGWDIWTDDPKLQQCGATLRGECTGLLWIAGEWPSWDEARAGLKREIDRLDPPLPLFDSDAH